MIIPIDTQVVADLMKKKDTTDWNDALTQVLDEFYGLATAVHEDMKDEK